MDEFVDLRRRMGWTQAQLAARLHLSQGYVSQVESGGRSLEPRTLELLRFIVAQERPDLIQARGPECAQRPENLVDGSWQDRAVAAERALSSLRSKLRELISSDQDAALDVAVASIPAAEHAARQGRYGPKRKSPRPTGRKHSPKPSAAGET